MKCLRFSLLEVFKIIFLEKIKGDFIYLIYSININISSKNTKEYERESKKYDNDIIVIIILFLGAQPVFIKT